VACRPRLIFTGVLPSGDGCVLPASDADCNATLQSLQAPDGRGVYVVGPCDISLRVATRESCNRFLPLMGRQLAGTASMCAHTTLTTLLTRRRSQAPVPGSASCAEANAEPASCCNSSFSACSCDR
jgi:hypothetical protein